MTIKGLIKKLIPSSLLSLYHYALPMIGSVVFGFPSKKLIVIGVTGTSGKSTTVDFLTKILEEHGEKVASASSIRFKVGQKEWKNTMKMTMPGRFIMQKLLRQAVNEKCTYAVVEVTSEGIKQYRHAFIHFDSAVFLNITPEHIDAHGSFENYRNEKLKLFKVAKRLHILNTDDKNISHFANIPAEKIVTFGIHNEATMKAENVQGMSFSVSDMQFTLHMLGEFNVHNALAAITTAWAYGIPLETCKKALEKVTGLPGRLEIVSKDPVVVVDYAFTPEQLKASYESVQHFSGQKNLVCVLGACGGGRDKWKRPILGSIAKQYCREIIITNEDPYDEDPWEIMEQVATGVKEENRTYHLVLDRKEAIQKAISLAQPGEAIVITGKGAEPLMCLANGKKIPWDDRQIVREVLGSKK